MTATAPSRPDRRSAVRVVRRLQGDYAFWASRYYTIRTKAGVLTTLKLNPVQRRLGKIEAELLRTHGEARIYCLKARQGGVSTDQQARSLHLIWSRRGVSAMTLGYSQENADKIFAITRRAVENFPYQLLPALGERVTREISFPGLDTTFWTGTAGAERTGRSVTLRRFHGSEFAFYDDPAGVLKTVTPALVPRGSVVVLETTAGGFDSEAHGFWRTASEGGNSYTPVFFPWWECDPANYRQRLLANDELGTLEADESVLVKRHGLDLEQIKWRRKNIRDLGREDFLQEYAEDPESCWLAPGGMFYSVELLKALRSRAPTPREVLLNGALELYDELPEGERVIIGADTAEGVGGDRSTFSARAFPSWRLLARYADNRVTPEDFADLLSEWGHRFHDALLVVEKNAHGITVLRRLRDVRDYNPDRIYRRIALDTDTTVERGTERLGWVTTGESRPLMLDAARQLFLAAEDGTAGVPSTACLQDAFAVRRDNTGRVSLNGRDVLVAEMLAWLGRTYPLHEVLIGRA